MYGPGKFELCATAEGHVNRDIDITVDTERQLSARHARRLLSGNESTICIERIGALAALRFISRKNYESSSYKGFRTHT